MTLISINRIASSIQFGEDLAITMLMTVIQEYGLMAPINVIRDKSRWFWWLCPKRYICVDGAGRLEACRRLSMKEIPAIVMKAETVNTIHRLNNLRSNDR